MNISEWMTNYDEIVQEAWSILMYMLFYFCDNFRSLNVGLERCSADFLCWLFALCATGLGRWEECKMQNCHKFQICSRMVWVEIPVLCSGREGRNNNSTSWVCAIWFISNIWVRIYNLPSWFRGRVHQKLDLRKRTCTVGGLVWVQRNQTQL